MIEETPQERLMTLGQLIGNAHQAILNAPRAKDEADKRAMRVLELAYARAVPADPVVSPADTIRLMTVTHTKSVTFVQAEVDAVWNSGLLPMDGVWLSGDEDTDPDARAIAIFTALDGSLLELFLERQDDDVSHEVGDYDPEA